MNFAFASHAGGGLDTYVLETGRWLTDHGHTVHVIYAGINLPPKLPRYTNLHFHTITIGNFHYYLGKADVFKSSLPRLVRLYESSRAMAYKLHEISAVSPLDIVELFEGYAFPRLFSSLPYVVKMHGAEWVLRQYCEDGPTNFWEKRLERRFLLSAKAIFAVSRAYGDYISGACNIPPRLMRVVRYPSDLAHFKPGTMPLHKPPFILMSVGRLEYRKGTHITIQALPKIWEAQPDTHLYLYGTDGNFGRPEIEKVLPASVHQGRIHFEGLVTRETLIERYQQCHLYLAPTRFETSGGFHIQEAMSCGRPIIASDIASIPELVRHRETGWLFPRDDHEALSKAVLFALDNPKICEAFGKEAWRQAQQFDAENVLSYQLALYAAIADE